MVAGRQESADLAHQIPRLAPEALEHLIQERGLEACADLLALATPEQLTAVLDLDLWHSGGADRGLVAGRPPGSDAQFDANRFGEWIEALVEVDAATAARVVASLDTDLVSIGLSHYVRVVDYATLTQTDIDDDERVVLGPTRDVDAEIGGYAISAKRPDAWDAIAALLVALDEQHQDAFHALMGACRALSDRGREDDGLDNLLGAAAQALEDAAARRDHRQFQQGYVSMDDAREFLRMCRQPAHERAGRSPFASVAAKYVFTEQAGGPGERQSLIAGATSSDGPRSSTTDVSYGDAATTDDAGDVPGRLEPIGRLMAVVERAGGAVEAARLGELAFLTNALLTGCTVRMRAFTPHEATDAVIGACNIGIERWPSGWPIAQGQTTTEAGRADTRPPIPHTFLFDHDLATAFEVGWSVLHHEVTLFVADGLIDVLDHLRCADREIQVRLQALRGQLARERRAGTPWLAGDALDALSPLDLPAWTAILGLLDECPLRADALTAIVERQTGAISATAFSFFSTTRHLDDVRAFMARLPEMLQGR